MNTENIKTWVLCICVVCIGSTILSLLLPADSISQTAKGVFSLVLISVVVLPLYGNRKDFAEFFSFSFETEGDLSTIQTGALYRQIADRAEMQIKNDIGKIIEKYSVDDFEIFMETDISSNASIDIKRIRIVFSCAPTDLQMMKQELLQYCPECEIEFTQEDTNGN